jgi:hypothetical protein
MADWQEIGLETQRQSVRETVEGHLEPHQPADYRLKVVGVRIDGDYYYVVVQPDRDDIRSTDYYNILVDVEDELEKGEHLNVLLVPTLPGD